MKTIFEKHFYPSFMQFNGDRFDLTVFGTEVDGNGNYNSEGYMECMHHKTTMMLQTIKENIGRTIVWSDIDIRFLGPIDLEGYNANMTILKEHWSPDEHILNPAFAKIQCDYTMVNFFERLLEVCKAEYIHDMDAIHLFRQQLPPIKIDPFDFRYLQFTSLRRMPLECDVCKNNTDGYNCLHQLVNLDQIDKTSTILYHANFTVANDRNTSMGLKLEQLDYLVK